LLASRAKLFIFFGDDYVEVASLNRNISTAGM
jgi:hypothetical protein